VNQAGWPSGRRGVGLARGGMFCLGWLEWFGLGGCVLFQWMLGLWCERLDGLENAFCRIQLASLLRCRVSK
jgi:hypothetical protein